MITEDYCSCDIARLIKEKGLVFAEHTSYIPKHNADGTAELITTITHQTAIKWLREIYDLHIIAYPVKSGNDTNIKHYCCQVFETFNLLGYEKYTNETLTSYEDAVETALKYALENLI